MWKSLVQGHVDYCSQLYQPLQSGSLQRLETLQKTFTKRIPEVRDKNYWDRLKMLKMNSQQRRLERYLIIYTWKILEGYAPNCGITTSYAASERGGRMCSVPKINHKQDTVSRHSDTNHFKSMAHNYSTLYQSTLEI